MPRKLIKLPVVLDRIAGSKSQLYRDMDNGIAPLSVVLGPNSVAWYEDEIEEYVNTRPRRTRPDAKLHPPSEDAPAAKSLGSAAIPGARQPVPA